MKNKELFDKTVAVLVKAYLGNTLKHSDCTACAVGNLVCANMYAGDFRLWDNAWRRNLDSCEEQWHDVFTTIGGKRQDFNPDKEIGEAALQIASTGYSSIELAQIEFAFEYGLDCERDEQNDADIYKGLMSVVDTLMLIHEASAQEAIEAKQLFVKV